MHMKYKFFYGLFAILSLILILGCKGIDSKEVELQNLKSWMTGSFSSEEQANLDSNFYNIHLHMVQIWVERTDAVWLYVEQAASWSLEKPYRQRVYRVSANEDGTFESAVFTFNDPLRFTGAWKNENPLSELTPDSLLEREGCALILHYEEGAFVGSTNEKDCTSNLRDASYATSEARIEENVLTSWDRGYDENGVQVWGAITGPYIFKKLKN